jgi:hypothetical protein
VTGAIVFLIAPRSFVFANQILIVFINRTGCHHPNLFVVAHDQAVQVNTGHFLGL